MGLLVGEAFKDSVYVYDTITGAPELGAAVTCVVIDQAGNRDHPAGGAVVEEGLGWYSCTWTPDAAGTWKTEWGCPAGMTIAYPFKEFLAGAGQEAALQTDITAILADTNELELDWKNGGRLDLLLDAAITDIIAVDGKVDIIDNFVDDLETRLTAARAGYLDELNFDLDARLGAPAGASLSADLLTIDNLVDDLETRLTAARAGYIDKVANHLITRTWFSDSLEEVALTDADTDPSCGSVVLPNITGTIVAVYAGFKFRMVENTNAAANSIDTDQYIQVQHAAEGLTNAIKFVDTQYSIAALTREGGDCVIGNIELSGTVHTFNATYNFTWTDADAHLDGIKFNDVQTFLIVSYY